MSTTGSFHYQLCVEAAKYLRRNKHDLKKCPGKACYRPDDHYALCHVCYPYHYIAVELCTWDTESPDVWALGAWNTVIVEVKVSRSDFLADRKKRWRSDDAEKACRQAGNLRWYLCPEGVIKPDELPEKWGLLYWDGKRILPIVAPRPFENTGMADMKILASILRREGFPKRIYNYRGARTTIQPKR